MLFDAPVLAQLSQACAPQIATEAMLPLIQVESGGDPLRINVNHGPRVWARSAPQAAALVRRFVAAGYSVDVGLAQINSRNFAHLGLTIETAFDPCTNLRASAQVLQEGYAHATLSYAGMAAIAATYSLYNTGSLAGGLRNGYVGRIWQAAGALMAPGMVSSPVASAGLDAIVGQAISPGKSAARPAAKRPNSDWVFGETQASAVVVFQ